jgi:predicted oxidoreductase
MDTLTISAAHRPLGRSALQVSPLAWGMWRFAGTDVPTARARVDAALAAGINFFDTADIYGADTPQGFGSAETLLGEVFARDKALRGRMVLASKGGIVLGVPYDSSARYITDACHISLKRLQTDYLDLYQIHRPDVLAHPAEVAAALTKLREAGKIREIGVSNHTTAQTRALQAHLDFPLVSHQPQFSPLDISPMTDGILDQALECNMSVLAWSPLGGGQLGAEPREARALSVYTALKKIADACGVGVSAVAYAWIMAHPTRAIPIIGSQNPARIQEAADAFKVTMTRRDWYDVLVAARGEKLP